MKTSFLWPVAGIAVAAATGWLIFVSKGKNPQTVPPSSQKLSQTQTDTATSQASGSNPEKAMAESSGKYLDFSQEAFQAAAEKKRILYFHADWCPTCRPLNRDFSSRQNELPDNVVVFKTNYDREADLKKTYGITYQHTFVLVDAEGRELAKWNGGDFGSVLNKIKNL